MLELAENVGLFLFVAIQKLYVFTAVGIGVVLRRRNNKSKWEFVEKTSTAKGYQRIWTKH